MWPLRRGPYVGGHDFSVGTVVVFLVSAALWPLAVGFVLFSQLHFMLAKKP